TPQPRIAPSRTEGFRGANGDRIPALGGQLSGAAERRSPASFLPNVGTRSLPRTFQRPGVGGGQATIPRFPMTRVLLAGAAIPLATASTAQAQPSAPAAHGAAAPAPSAGAAPAAPGAAAGTPATAANLKPGAMIKDSTGGTIGSVNRVGKTADGQD